MKDFILGLLVMACMVFAFGVEYAAYATKSHTVSTDILAGVSLFSAIGLAIPMRFDGLVNQARKLIPYADRRRDYSGEYRGQRHDDPMPPREPRGPGL